MRLILSISFFVFSGSGLFAQENANIEKISLIVGNYYVPQAAYETFFKPTVRHLGVKYEYGFNSHISFSATYCIWKSGRKIRTYFTEVDMFDPSMNGYIEDISFVSTWQKGDISNRFNYQMIDLGVIATLPMKKHALFAGAGPSYCTGKNVVIQSVYLPPNSFDVLVTAKDVRASYFGLMATAGYGYSINRRFNVGVSETLRYYPEMSAQYYFNVNVDYKFNLLSRLYRTKNKNVILNTGRSICLDLK